MKDSLERMNDLVHGVIACRHEVLSEDHPLFKWKDSFKKEKENVKKYMRQRCLKLADKQKISAFVYECYTQVVDLSDFVYLEDSNVLLRAEENSCLSIMKGLQKLLGYIEDHFKDYVNVESKLPLYEFDKLQHQYRIEYKSIRKKLKGAEDEDVINHVFLQLSELTITKEKLTSNIKYLRFFVEKLREFADHREEMEDDGYSLVDFLIAMNFNTTNLFMYVIRSINSDVEKRIDMPEKLFVLTQTQKKLRQGIQLSSEKLYPKTGNTKDLVLNWINEEISAMAGGLRPEVKNMPVAKTKNKMKCLFSGAVLAILMKAAKDTKAISGTDSMIAAFVKEYIETITGISPSGKSFINNMYHKETGSTAKSLAILEEMRKSILNSD